MLLTLKLSESSFKCNCPSKSALQGYAAFSLSKLQGVICKINLYIKNTLCAISISQVDENAEQRIELKPWKYLLRIFDKGLVSPELEIREIVNKRYASQNIHPSSKWIQ